MTLTPTQRLLRTAEFVALFVGVPVLLLAYQVLMRHMGRQPQSVIAPLLILMSTTILVGLVATRKTCLRDLFMLRGVTARDWGIVLSRFAFFAVAIGIFMVVKYPDWFFALPRHRPDIWVLVMIFYPLISVTAQGIIYRLFYAVRYAPVFPARWRVPVGAAVFSLAHLPFENLYALLFTLIGGLFFLTTYRNTKSLFFANIEHALYGAFIFTIGLGNFFFHAGTLRALGH